jgi:hypothetical protein
VFGAGHESLHNRLRAAKIHIGHPHWQDTICTEAFVRMLPMEQIIALLNEFPFDGVSAAAVNFIIESVLHCFHHFYGLSRK